MGGEVVFLEGEALQSLCPDLHEPGTESKRFGGEVVEAKQFFGGAKARVTGEEGGGRYGRQGLEPHCHLFLFYFFLCYFFFKPHVLSSFRERML